PNSTWTARGTIAGALTGLTGVVNGNSVVLYATSGTGGVGGIGGNTIVSFTDSAAFNANISGTFATIATAATNTVFRGVSFAPANTTGVPTIVSQPANAAIEFGTTATLNVTPCGSAPTYQWYQGASG